MLILTFSSCTFVVFEKVKISCKVKVIVLKNSFKTFACEKTMVTMAVGMKNILISLSVLRNLEKIFHVVIPKG